jgi:hypothetical protein
VAIYVEGRGSVGVAEPAAHRPDGREDEPTQERGAGVPSHREKPTRSSLLRSPAQVIFITCPREDSNLRVVGQFRSERGAVGHFGRGRFGLSLALGGTSGPSGPSLVASERLAGRAGSRPNGDASVSASASNACRPRLHRQVGQLLLPLLDRLGRPLLHLPDLTREDVRRCLIDGLLVRKSLALQV